MNPEICIYPNPTTNNITIDLNVGELSEIEVALITLTGITIHESVIFRQEVGNISDDISLDQFSLKKGIYLVKVTIDGENSVRKILYQ
jgi:hypothetical protein